MKAWLLYILALCSALSFGADTAVELNLQDGSKIKGRIMSSTASDVTVMSDFGVLRISLEKLSAESRELVSQGSKPDVEALLRRISELEARIAQLQQENESLRRQAAAAPAPVYRPSPSQFAPAGEAPSQGMRYTRSSTGKRHNSGCRYYGTGTPCGPNDGIACKICGG